MKINKETTQSIIDNVDLANGQIKLLEQENKNLPVPAIKQLRDVAYHLVRAFDAEEDSVERKKQLKLAEGHAVRAKYDIYDLRILFYLDNVNVLTDEFNSMVLETMVVLPEYNDLISQIMQIKDEFEKNIDEQPDSRQQYYQNIKDEILALKLVHNKLKAAYPTIKQLNEKERKKASEKQTTESARFVLNTSISIVTIIVTSVIGMITLGFPNP